MMFVNVLYIIFITLSVYLYDSFPPYGLQTHVDQGNL